MLRWSSVLLGRTSNFEHSQWGQISLHARCLGRRRLWMMDNECWTDSQAPDPTRVIYIHIHYIWHKTDTAKSTADLLSQAWALLGFRNNARRGVCRRSIQAICSRYAAAGKPAAKPLLLPPHCCSFLLRAHVCIPSHLHLDQSCFHWSFSTGAMQGLFFMTPEKDGHFSFSLMDLGARSMPLDIDSAFSFLTEQNGNHNLILLDSCNGLLLFGHQRKPWYYEQASGYIVCNPTTKQWEAVPPCGSPQGLIHTYLAFNPVVSSHFHLVQFQKTSVYLESMSVHTYLSKTGTWSCNQTEEEEEEEQGQSEVWKNHVHLSINRCAFVNGLIPAFHSSGLVWTTTGSCCRCTQKNKKDDQIAKCDCKPWEMLVYLFWSIPRVSALHY